MSILAEYFMRAWPEFKVHANYQLKDSEPVKSVKDLLAVKDGIVCLDEFWVTMDSRAWKDNVFLSTWINQTRKKNLLVLYTTQAFGQIDLRVRNATDLLIFCEKIVAPQPFFRYSFISGGAKTILKSFKIPVDRASNFYDVYDSFQVIFSLQRQSYGQDRFRPYQRSY